MLGDHRREPLCVRAAHLVQLVAAFQSEKGGHGRDRVVPGDVLGLVDVDLEELNAAGELGGELRAWGEGGWLARVPT